ncbi:MAG: hypothetical protein WD045_06275 [Pirellulaceae bacterium]
MAKLSPGLRKDWKDRSQSRPRPVRRNIRLAVAAGLFFVLLGVLIYILIPRDLPRTFLITSDPIDYDLLSVVPLVHSSLREEVSKPEHHNEVTTFISNFTLGDSAPSLSRMFSSQTQQPPGSDDSLVVYVQAHAIVHESEGEEARLLLATPTFLRESRRNWFRDGVVDVARVLDWMEATPCGTKLLLLDAGTLMTDGRLGVFENKIAEVLEKEMVGRSDRSLYALISHQQDQQSLAFSLNRNSIFTQAVQEALIGEGEILNNDGDTELSLDELYRHVCSRVFDHLGEGYIRQTPWLLRGGEGRLTEDFPTALVCRYRVVEPEEESAPEEATARRSGPRSGDHAGPVDFRLRHVLGPQSSLAWQGKRHRLLAQAEGNPSPAPAEDAPPPAPAAEAPLPPNAAAAEPPPIGAPPSAEDARFSMLDQIWALRDQLAQPPGIRKGVWSAVDFAPYQLRRLDQFLIGFHQRLLFNSGAAQNETLEGVKHSLEILVRHVEAGTPIASIPPKTDIPVDNLIEAWNAFLVRPSTIDWMRELTPSGVTARDHLLGLNHALYYTPEIVRLYELLGGDASLGEIRELMAALREATTGTAALAERSDPESTVDQLPAAGMIENALRKIADLRRIAPTDLRVSQGGRNGQMGDILRLLAYLQTNIPTAAQRAVIVRELREVSRRPLPPITLIAPNEPFLQNVQPSNRRRSATADNVKQLRQSMVEIAAQGIPLEQGVDPYTEIGRLVPSTLPRDATLVDSLAYQVRTRILSWQDIPLTSTVREVPPLPIRFPLLQRLPRLRIAQGGQRQSIVINRKGEKVPFAFSLNAEDIAPQVVTFELQYDHDLFELEFKRGQLLSGGERYQFNVDSNGPVSIEGFLTARLDREQYAQRLQSSQVRDVDKAMVALIIPPEYQVESQTEPPQIEASLPWADEIELVVRQSGAESAGVFFGERVQLPLYANRVTELTFGLLNRSRIPRKVNISFYPVERPVNSVMPLGRIFSRQYHFKPEGDAEGSKSRELNDWWINSYARPRSDLGSRFGPVAIAQPLELPPIDQIPPPSSRERGAIINTAIEAEKFQKLALAGPPGPPGPDGAPGPSPPLTKLNMSSGLLCIIEDPDHPSSDGEPKRWVKWIELVPRPPRQYLDSRVELVPVDNQVQLNLEISPKGEADAYPRATWDASRLQGFAGLPRDLMKVPVLASWDWEMAFQERDLSRRITSGTLADLSSTIGLGARLNLPNRKGMVRTMLVDVAGFVEAPTLRRAFRHVVDLESGRTDQEGSAGYHLLRLDRYTAKRTTDEPPPEAIPVMRTPTDPQGAPLLLPTDITEIDLEFSISTDTNSFNYASEINPDRIDVALLETDNRFENARLGFSTSRFANYQFGATLQAASPEGPVQILATLDDLRFSLNAKTNESFVGDLVARVTTSSGKAIPELRIPVLIDKDPPRVDVTIDPIEMPVNGEHTLTIPTSDRHSGISRLVLGKPGPNKGFQGEAKIRQPLPGNIKANANDPYLRSPVFTYVLRPADFQWEPGSTYPLRIKTVDKAGLESEPVDFVVRVGPEKKMSNTPEAMPEMVIKVQVLFVNGRPALDPQYQPQLKELPLVPRLDADKKTWVFRSKTLVAGKEYTVMASGRPVAGAPLAAEQSVLATPATQQAPIHRLQFK